MCLHSEGTLATWPSQTPKTKNGEGERKRWSRLRGHVFEGGCRDADD